VNLPLGPFDLILCDPPLNFDTWSAKGDGRSPQRKYRCMALPELLAMPVAEIAAPDAILAMWVYGPRLPDTLALIAGWGFTYVANGFTWVKVTGQGKLHFGTGYYTRKGAEQLLLAKRGNGLKRHDRGVHEVILAPRREHSRKPDEVAEGLERLFGDVRRLELFARTPRPGWTSYGDQLPDAGADMVTGQAHSRIGPSQAELVWNCPGSVKAQDAAGPRVAGEAAERGTDLHRLAEDCLRTGARSTDPVVTFYVDMVREIARRADVAPLIEQRLDLSAWHPELFGTADAIVVALAWGSLVVFDLKSGLIHVPADALQLKLYAGMAFMALPAADQRKIMWIDTLVVQPNGSMDSARRARHRVADIIKTLSAFVDIAHVATDDPNPPLHAGPWCRKNFCSARTSCDAFRAFTAQEAIAEFTAEAEGGART
jgi:N6-adenosine-specific RNA methylase IME4